MVILNAMGEPCPKPVVMAKNALEELGEGGILKISVDNEIATQNLEKMAKSLGVAFKAEAVGAEHFEVTLTKGSGETAVPYGPKSKTIKDGTVIVIMYDVMGTGEGSIGDALTKSFLFSVSELDELPTKIILLNTGVNLSTTNEEAIAILKKLEDLGVSILSCGACLAFYKLTDKLAVGTVTSMYEVAKILVSTSEKVIRL